jgi:hypothetical protein
LFETHAINSGVSLYISLITSEEVAQSFARGASGTPAGFVTKFRLPKNFTEANFERTSRMRAALRGSGFLSGGGFGISYGQRTTCTEQNRTIAVQGGQARSIVDSIGGAPT